MHIHVIEICIRIDYLNAINLITETKGMFSLM